MSSKEQFDFWYAVNNTEILDAPKNRLETFGDTIVNYYLICPFMDDITKTRVREGQLKALKPAIITPQMLGHLDMEDFGDQAKEYAEWLSNNGNDLKIIQYGFKIQKTEIKEYEITDNMENVVDRVRTEVNAKNDPLSSVIVGVDEPWEVCLLKLMVELVQKSASGNMNDIRQQAINMTQQIESDIERSFIDASRDPSKINSLGEKLKKANLFKRYEDRFFALVKASR